MGAVSPPGRSRQVRDDGLDQAGVGDYRDQRRLRPLAALKQPVGDVRAGPQYGTSRVDNVGKGRGRPPEGDETVSVAVNETRAAASSRPSQGLCSSAILRIVAWIPR